MSLPTFRIETGDDAVRDTKVFASFPELPGLDLELTTYATSVYKDADSPVVHVMLVGQSNIPLHEPLMLDASDPRKSEKQ